MKISEMLPMVEHLHEFVRIRGGVARLRSAVLDLAIGGALVPAIQVEGTGKEFAQELGVKEFVFGSAWNETLNLSIPDTWTWVALGSLAIKIGSGSTPRGGKSVYVEQGPLFLRSQNVWDSGLRLDDAAHIPEVVHAAMKGTAVAPGDVLLNITGASIGRSAIAPADIGEANVSQHVMIIRPISPELSPFLHLSLISPYFQRLISLVQVGISREGLSKKQAEKLPIPFPPLDEQRRIVEKVQELMQLIDLLREQLAA
jgi:type I restriction enzyme S subunit